MTIEDIGETTMVQPKLVRVASQSFPSLLKRLKICEYLRLFFLSSTVFPHCLLNDFPVQGICCFQGFNSH